MSGSKPAFFLPHYITSKNWGRETSGHGVWRHQTADGDLLIEESDKAAGGDILPGDLQVSTILNSETWPY